MKRTIATILAILTLCVGSVTAQNTFNVAAMNVDGLPNSILGINLNPDGPGASGTLAISEKLATMGYDIIGVSEDFNYHNELMTYMQAYNFATYRGGITMSGYQPNVSFNTDGLELFWKQDITVMNEGIYGWNQKYGKFTNGADELIDKGFRYYQVTVNDSVTIDLYIVHMDAETDSLDNAARWSQWSQLASMILASNNGHPIIVMGDTNSRYTRDKIIDNFINPLEEDGRFTVTDAWVEKEYDGVYPEFGTDALMVWELGYQKGEVVDKVLYINNRASNYTLSANYYLQDTSFVNSEGTALADHWPIVVEFTYEKRAESPNVYHTNATEVNWQGENPTDGGRYYIFHPGTRTFLSNDNTTLTAVSEPSYAWLMTYQSDNQGIYTMNMFSGAYYFYLNKTGVFGSSATPALSSDIQTIQVSLSSTNTARNAYKIHRTASPARFLNYDGDIFTGAQGQSEQNDWIFISQQQFRDSMRTYASWEATICSNEPYDEEPFVGFHEEGVYWGTLVNHFGYDSVIMLTLHVLPAYEYIEEHTLTIGDSIEFRGEWFHATETGTFILDESHQTIHGCDSVYEASITVVPNSGTMLPTEREERVLATKVLINGQLYIRKEDAVFDPSGRRIGTIKE